MPNSKVKHIYNTYSVKNLQNFEIGLYKKIKKSIELNNFEKLETIFEPLYFFRLNFRKYFIKRWFLALLSVIPKRGLVIKYKNYLLKALKKLSKKYSLFEFFYKIESKRSNISFETLKKKIAGRTVLIPLPLEPYKQLNAMARLIITSTKIRKEKSFVDRFYNELIDVYKGKGITLNRKITYLKMIKENLINLRFLNAKRRR